MYASYARNSMTDGSETRPLLADLRLMFEREEMQMIMWMCGVSMKDRKKSWLELSLSQLSIEVVD